MNQENTQNSNEKHDPNQPFMTAVEPAQQPEAAPERSVRHFDILDEPETVNDFDALFSGETEAETHSGDDAEMEDFDPAALPDFDFAVPPEITLRDGTGCVFKIPDLASEQRADALRTTTTIISPAKINGQNPQQDFTDHVKADIRYFLDNAVGLKHFVFNEGDAPADFDARAQVATQNVNGREIPVTYAHLVPIKHKRAFVARLYGGKIEVEKPKDADQQLVALNSARTVTVRQDLGVESTKDGKTTKPTHIIRYRFREPQSGHLSKWQRCWNGFKVPIKGGGSKSESSFKTDAVAKLFDDLIESVSGAAWQGAPLEVKNTSHLAAIPVGVKRNMMAIAMGEFTGDVGND